MNGCGSSPIKLYFQKGWLSVPTALLYERAAIWARQKSAQLEPIKSIRARQTDMGFINK